jgi:hypothetical protein
MRALNISPGLVAIHGNPILDALLGEWLPSHEVIVDVVKALSPCFQTFFLEDDQLGAEATPKAGLTIATDATIFELCLQIVIIRKLMIPLQVILKTLSAVTHLGTGAAFRSLLITSPCLQVIMLRIFMPLPVVLAPKGLAAGQEGAAIRPLVTFHVFPVQLLAGDFLNMRRHT